MNDDKTIVSSVEIPGMQISFQSPIGPSGKGISFVFSAPAEIEIDDLNRCLDNIASAARRQDAFEQLRLDQNSLLANRKLLAKARAARDVAQEMLDGKVAQISGTRRRSADATQAPQHMSAVMQHDQRITEIEGQIAGCEERIPFWKAILRGEEPLDLEPEAPKMAAE